MLGELLLIVALLMQLLLAELMHYCWLNQSDISYSDSNILCLLFKTQPILPKVTCSAQMTSGVKSQKSQFLIPQIF